MLESSSCDSDDSNNKQGYEYNNDANDWVASASSSNETSQHSNESTSSKPSDDIIDDDVIEFEVGNPDVQRKGGRPVGTTDDKKREQGEKEAQAKFKIICRYMYERCHAKAQGLTDKELFYDIVDDEKRVRR